MATDLLLETRDLTSRQRTHPSVIESSMQDTAISGMPFSPDEDRIIVGMRNMGRTWEQIADALPGRSLVGVSHRYTRIVGGSKERIYAAGADAQGDGIAGNGHREREAAEQGSRSLLRGYIAYARRYHPGSPLASIVA